MQQIDGVTLAGPHTKAWSLIDGITIEVNRIRAHQARLPRNDERRNITACAPSCLLNLCTIA